MPTKQNSIKNYLSLVKFSHTIFALPFALLGYFIAVGLHKYPFRWELLVLVILCMVTARNAAMSFNRVTDRFIDKRNPRTSSREIPSGLIHPRNALIFSIINAIAFIITTFFINKLVFFLSPIALAIILGYSYTKRYTIFCHFILGVSLALAPIGAYLAITGSWSYIPIIISFIVLFWVAGFDIVYSLQDEDFDKEEHLKSIPAVLGRKVATMIAVTLHGFVLLLVVKIGIATSSGLIYWIGAAIFIGLLAYQHYTVRKKNFSNVNFAFATLNGLASIIYSCFFIISIFF